MNKWIRLSGELYYFGQGGVTKVISQDIYLTDGKKSEYATRLMHGSLTLGQVTESIEFIEIALKAKGV